MALLVLPRWPRWDSLELMLARRRAAMAREKVKVRAKAKGRISRRRASPALVVGMAAEGQAPERSESVERRKRPLRLGQLGRPVPLVPAVAAAEPVQRARPARPGHKVPPVVARALDRLAQPGQLEPVGSMDRREAWARWARLALPVRRVVLAQPVRTEPLACLVWQGHKAKSGRQVLPALPGPSARRVIPGRLVTTGYLDPRVRRAQREIPASLVHRVPLVDPAPRVRMERLDSPV